jgi:hypothetical protein
MGEDVGHCYSIYSQRKGDGGAKGSRPFSWGSSRFVYSIEEIGPDVIHNSSQAASPGNFEAHLRIRDTGGKNGAAVGTGEVDSAACDFVGLTRNSPVGQSDPGADGIGIRRASAKFDGEARGARLIDP